MRWLVILAALGAASYANLASAAVSSEDVIFDAAVISGTTDLPGGGEVGEIMSTSMDGGRVIFYASTEGAWPEVYGLWSHEAGRIKAVVNTDTLVPGSIIHFAGFEHYRQDGNATAFVGRYPEQCGAGDCGGIYVHESGRYRFVVDTNQPVPDRDSDFEGLNGVALDGDDVAFVGAVRIAEYDHGYGIYADLGDGITTVADWETPAPGGTGELRVNYWGGSLAIEDGVVYFSAESTDYYEYGYYSWDSATGAYAVLRDGSTQVPGSQTEFDYARNDVFCGGTYAFIGEWDSWEEQAVFADFGDGLEKVAGSEDIQPEDAMSGQAWFNELSACGGTLAFTVTDPNSNSLSLYLYRHGDDALIPMLRRGDIVAGREVEEIYIYPDAASGESVAAIVRFRDSWRAGIVVASVHRPLHPMLVSTDLDKNGFDEVVLLRQDSRARRYSAQIRDAYTGGMTAMTQLGKLPVYDLALAERPNGSARLAVLARNNWRRALLDFVDPLTGELKKRVKLWTNTEPVGLAIVPDINGNGFDEVAATGINDAGILKIQIRDTRGGAKISGFSSPVALRPTEMFAIDDLDGAGAPELVLVGVAPDSGQVHTEIVDTLTGTQLGSFDMGNASKSVLMDATLIEDLDNDGVDELAVARVLTASAQSGWQVWSLATGSKLQAAFANIEVSRLGIATVADGSGDGLEDIGLMRTKRNGTTQVEIFDSVARTRIARYWMKAVEHGRGLVVVEDIDGAGVEELVVMGEHFDANLLEIHDCAEGTALRYYAIP